MSTDKYMSREEIARAIESVPIEPGSTNALGMRIAAAKIARGEENYITEWFKSFE